MAKGKKRGDALEFDDGPGLGMGDGGGLFADEHPDPIGPIAYPGTADGDTRATLDAVGQAFKDRARAERERFKAATDSEYWFAVVFETREQKEAFLRAMKWLKLGDKHLDGCLLAEQEGISLPPASVPYVAAKPDRKLDQISLPLEGGDDGR